MALDINLEVYNSTDTEKTERLALHLGKKLKGFSTYNGWAWVRENGMSVEGPWILDKEDGKIGYIVEKVQLKAWIKEGYLSRSSDGEDTTTDFLEKFPSDSIFRIWFMDWS